MQLWQGHFAQHGPDLLAGCSGAYLTWPTAAIFCLQAVLRLTHHDWIILSESRQPLSACFCCLLLRIAGCHCC